MYRADFPRTLALVVALFLTVTATSAFAREFRVADTQGRDYPTVQALYYIDHLIQERTGGRLQIRVFHSRQLGGADSNWPSFTTDHYRYASFDTPTEHTMSPEVLVMSLTSQSQSPEAKKLFREVAQESSRFMREKWRNVGDRSRQQAEAAGIIRDFDRKPFEAAMDAVYEKVQRDPAAAGLIERISQVE